VKYEKNLWHIAPLNIHRYGFYVETVLENESTKLNRRIDIDGLRAIAVISVVIGHYFPIYCKRGFLGVDVFFVISGYVITQLLFSMQKLKYQEFLIVFYAKRILRLLPALFVVVMVFSLIFAFSVTRTEGMAHKTLLYILGRWE
jgi:peptidoglycan/LPS O-acetylase OafA/YrhL